MSTFTFTLTSPSSPAVPDAAPLAREPNHAGVAVDRLLHQFKGKPRIEATLRRLMEMTQSAEDVLWQLATERFLDPVPTGEGPAIGAQLDVIGEIVGEPRAGRGDDEYRTFLRVRILVNNSDGKIEELIEILSLLLEQDIRILEQPPAHLDASVTESVYPLEANRFLRQAKAAGVGLRYVYSLDPLNETFQASGLYDAEEYDTDRGAGSVYSGAVGGKSAGVFGS